MPEISVVIPARNEADTLPIALAAIARELQGVPHEVIVVDHESTDDTRGIAARAGARVLRQQGGTISDLRNTGTAAARGEWIAYLDADVVVCPGWFEGLRRAQEACGEDPLTLCGLAYGIGDNPTWIERVWFDPALRSGEQHLPGGNLVLRRDLAQRVGGFDSAMVTGEDVDFCRRVVAAGGRLVRIPELDTHHLGNPSTLLAFARKQVWHGQGDFLTLQTVRESKVAIVTLAWAGLHLLALLTLPFVPVVAVVLWLGAVGLCGLSAVAKGGPFAQLPARVALYYAYFAGRAVSPIKAPRGQRAAAVLHHAPLR